MVHPVGENNSRETNFIVFAGPQLHMSKASVIMGEHHIAGLDQIGDDGLNHREWT